MVLRVYVTSFVIKIAEIFLFKVSCNNFAVSFHHRGKEETWRGIVRSNRFRKNRGELKS